MQVAQVARDGHLQTNSIHPQSVSHLILIIPTHNGSERGERGKSHYLSLEPCNPPAHRASPFHVGHGKDLVE